MLFSYDEYVCNIYGHFSRVFHTIFRSGNLDVLIVKRTSPTIAKFRSIFPGGGWARGQAVN